MAESIHDKLKRVRKPRVHITYDVETNGAVHRRFVVPCSRLELRCGDRFEELELFGKAE